MRLTRRSRSWRAATATADDTGKATVKFTDTFLQSGTAAASPSGTLASLLALGGAAALAAYGARRKRHE